MHRKKETTVVSVMCVPWTQRPSCTLYPLLALAKQEAMWGVMAVIHSGEHLTCLPSCGEHRLYYWRKVLHQ